MFRERDTVAWKPVTTPRRSSSYVRGGKGNLVVTALMHHQYTAAKFKGPTWVWVAAGFLMASSSSSLPSSATLLHSPPTSVRLARNTSSFLHDSEAKRNKETNERTVLPFTTTIEKYREYVLALRRAEHEGETRREGVTRSSRRGERGEDFLKLHFVAPERPYTGISTPTARDNEASTGAPFVESKRAASRWRWRAGSEEKIASQSRGLVEKTREGKKEEKEKKETKDHRDRTGINDLPKLWQRPPKRRHRASFTSIVLASSPFSR
ncbi:Uncharacterized protein DBV15_07556 [Temnothorax longispinosus]|uniref:Uncharacterized protein n=1 Tax=Temnothorax longispinosus TaxID=300112 RepID=A0A4S2KTD2_9HYME|nr:Uncharacterized protein DBV15_07556 [Temnothorax longispinosus]